MGLNKMKGEIRIESEFKGLITRVCSYVLIILSL